MTWVLPIPELISTAGSSSLDGDAALIDSSLVRVTVLLRSSSGRPSETLTVCLLSAAICLLNRLGFPAPITHESSRIRRRYASLCLWSHRTLRRCTGTTGPLLECNPCDHIFAFTVKADTGSRITDSILTTPHTESLRYQMAYYSLTSLLHLR